MDKPDGVDFKDNRKVLRLLGSLYGLKQSANIWWKDLGDGLKKLAYKRLTSDWGVYVKFDKAGPVYLIVYVDDIVALASELAEQTLRWTRLAAFGRSPS